MDMARYGGREKWRRIVLAILRRAGERRDVEGKIIRDAHCERCGVENHSLVWRFHKKGYTRIVLTTAHIGAPFATGDSFDEWNGWRPGDKHDKLDIRAENLLSLCQKCHLLDDLADHLRKGAETRRQKKKLAGQLTLLELEQTA